MSETQVVGQTTTEESDPLVEIRGLKKHFVQNDSLFARLNPTMETQRVRAVDGVDMDLHQGETRGLVGESGCGKSTLARLILRLIEPTSGSIRIDGEDITTLNKTEMKAFRRKVQIIFQDPFSSLNPRYTVLRTLTEPMQTHGIGESKREREDMAVDLMRQVGLDPDYLSRHPHEFSGGQRQRVGIARALAVNPDILIADEPTTALDVTIQADILTLLDDLQAERNLTTLFISHDLSTIRHISDTVSVMYLGKLVETAEVTSLFTDPKHPYTQSLLTSIPSPDPRGKTEFVPLKGDVPTPINPPSGCSFHTRCPQVIQPATLSMDQPDWKDVFDFKLDVANEKISTEYLESLVESEGYDSYIADEINDSLPPTIVQTLETAIDHLLDGDDDTAVSVLDDAFTSPCERVRPPEYAVDGHEVRCHLYDPTDSYERAQPEATAPGATDDAGP